jgi:murein tripeptide amidase MpaA
MPYGEAQLRDSLAAGQDYWQESRIGTTCNGRSIPRLNNAIGGDHNRPGIYCTGRNHSGETPGAWALDGFIRRFAERNVEDVALWVVPFVDRDGVDEGRYGKDHWPRDFNRA